MATNIRQCIFIEILKHWCLKNAMILNITSFNFQYSRVQSCFLGILTLVFLLMIKMVRKVSSLRNSPAYLYRHHLLVTDCYKISYTAITVAAKGPYLIVYQGLHNIFGVFLHNQTSTLNIITRECRL